MWAKQQLRLILDQCNEQHGWQIPLHVTDYVSGILADKIDKNPWQPLPSYAECYLNLRTPAEALSLGNTCWFTRAVFPELGERRGLKASYYVDLGQGCYEMVLKYTEFPAIRTLHKHFEFLAETAYTAIRHQGEFREMWD